MTFLRVMVFSIAVLLCYTVFANILPQVQSDPPSQEEGPSGTLDMAGLIAYGEKLFSGKGACTLCHNSLGRAPDLLKLDLAKTFAERLADPRYSGKAASEKDARAIEVYIRESMLDPSAYVVSGFGKKGSNDTISPMPKANAPPIELSKVQVIALVAFLQEKAGVQPSVTIPNAADIGSEGVGKPGDKKDEPEEEEEGPATTAATALEKFTCNACHDLEGSKADAGPKLNGIAGRMSREKVVEAIIKPNAQIAKGFEADMMPQDFGQQMRVSELNLIVDYLMNLKN